MKRAALTALVLLLALPLGALGQGIAPALDPTVAPTPLSIAPLTSAGEATKELYGVLREEAPEELALFLKQLPKGADLHHHYSGSIYAETYLEWAQDMGVKINPETFQLEGYKKDPDAIPVEEFMQDPDRVEALLRKWSVKGYDPAAPDAPGADQAFFDTFIYFGGFATKTYERGFVLLRDRAIENNVVYIETLLSGVPFYLSRYGDAAKKKLDEQNEALTTASPAELPTVLAELAEEWEQSSKFTKAVDGFVEELEEVHQKVGVDDERFMMRYHTYAIREKDPVSVYSGLVAAFAAAQKSELIVAVNLVGLENGEFATKDYSLHMRMLEFLQDRYPGIRVALHAGEITEHLVQPTDLGFHVREAIEVARARRIGHGIDIPHDPDAQGLMQLMAERGIAVEVNLTSNEFILGVEGDAHPYALLRDAGVPLVLSTDDQGVVRNDINYEYGLLATRHEADYEQVKRLVYNSIQYSFLDDATKDRLKTTLDERFTAFEDAMAAYAAARQASAPAAPETKPAVDLGLGEDPK